MSEKVILVGAGIVGVSTGLRLQRKGFKVVLIDPKPPGMETSFGNAGVIAQGYCTANAHPGLFKQLPSLLGEKNSPLSIRWSDWSANLPWLLRFARQALPTASARNGKHLHRLSQLAVDGWQDLIRDTQLDRYIQRTGWLHLYESNRLFQNHLNDLPFLRDHGIDIEPLNPGQIADLEPELAPCFAGGSLQNDALSLTNPHAVVRGLADALVAAGGQIVQDNILTVSTDASGRHCQAMKSAARSYVADHYIITAGVWSKPLAVQCGMPSGLPLIAERGYHIMLPQPAPGRGLNRPIAFGDLSFLLCPMTDGIRMTGQVELAKPDSKPQYKRHRQLLPNAKRYVPNLDVREQSIWMGNRPSLPDSLPVIGRSPALRNVILGFGHQHLGMTLGPITARLIEQLVRQQDTEIPLAPYRADRFS